MMPYDVIMVGVASSEVPVTTFSELILYPTKSTHTTYLPSIHGDWVAKVLYCPYMEMCMSCSNDSSCSLHLADCHGRKEGTVLTVRKGVASFDYSRDLNMIGLCGGCGVGSCDVISLQSRGV